MSDHIDDTAMEDFGPDIITLTSEDGEEFQFELLDRSEFEGAEYVALVPIYDEEEEQEFPEQEEDDLIFMKVIEDGGEEYLESMDDEAEYDRVTEFFTERLSDQFDIL